MSYKNKIHEPTYDGIESLEEAISIIHRQDAMIGKLTREVGDLNDTQQRLNQVNRKRKNDAGYNSNVSFDLVWEQTLTQAKKVEEYKNLLRKYKHLIDAGDLNLL